MHVSGLKITFYTNKLSYSLILKAIDMAKICKIASKSFKNFPAFTVDSRNVLLLATANAASIENS